MGRLIRWNLLTVDGYFEGAKPWELDGHEYVWDESLERLSLERPGIAEALLSGRVTCEGMVARCSGARTHGDATFASRACS